MNNKSCQNTAYKLRHCVYIAFHDLAGIAQWAEHWSANREGSGSHLCWAVGQVPS